MDWLGLRSWGPERAPSLTPEPWLRIFLTLSKPYLLMASKDNKASHLASDGTGNLRWQVCADADEVARLAASRIAALLRAKPDAVLGLATGSTPERTYAELVRLHDQEGLSFARATTFNLDEYWALPGDHPQSYRYFMQQRLFDHIDIAPWNTHFFNGMVRHAELECDAFEARILAHGGVDLWLLGIGANGHIAFNEPGSAVGSRSRLVTLAPETVAANSDGRFFSDPDQVPRCALTAGIATIRAAASILLLATGAGKAPAVAAALQRPLDPSCPASLLQDHRDCTFVVDVDAAGDLDQSEPARKGRHQTGGNAT